MTKLASHTGCAVRLQCDADFHAEGIPRQSLSEDCLEVSL